MVFELFRLGIVFTVFGNAQFLNVFLSIIIDKKAQKVIVIMCDYLTKLLKTHFFILQCRSH